MSDTTWNIGDEVMPNPASGWGADVLGVKYTITELPKGARGVNYRAARVGGGQGLRARASQLVAYSEDKATATMAPYVPGPLPGAIVTVDHSKVAADSLWYVEGPARGKSNATKLLPIGDNNDGRYFPSMPNEHIRTVKAPEGGWTLTALGLSHDES